jgi:hypothetical protein
MLNMRVTARRIATFAVSLIGLLFLAGPGIAQTASIKDRLLGNWQLVSVTINDNQPYGKDPTGTLFADADGRFSVIVISAGNAANMAYFGTYMVDEADSTVTLHIDGGVNAGATGRTYKRAVVFNGAQLTVNTIVSATNKNAISLVFKRPG